MSDVKISSWLQHVEKMLEFTIQAVSRCINAKAVVIIVVHQDATTQSSAMISPAIEQRTAFALRAMADKIETGKGAKVQMSEKFKN